MKHNYITTLLWGVLSLSIQSCGDKKSDEPAPSREGGYVVSVGSASTTTIELSGGSGQEYVISPYTLGDHATVFGAGAQNLTFGISATSASLQEFKKSPALESPMDRSNTLRLIANRFDATKGRNQEAWIWPTLTRLDMTMNADLAVKPKTNFRNVVTLTKQYEAIADRGVSAIDLPQNLLANCPATVVAADGTTNITLATSYDGTSFCVGYQADPTDTKANVEASVKAVLESYKNTIYQDQMTANTKDGYSFNPIVVFVSSLAYDGAFSKTATTVSKRPVLHIKASLAKDKIHPTIAHEMQHAIVDYYKQRGTSLITETVGIDEGVAHLMEDAFGYGVSNFASYVKNFLSGYVDGEPILANDDGANAAAARGGANALVYFMAVRAGGFTVTNGKPFSGPGLSALVSMVKQTTLNGPAGLSAAFGKSNLTESVGQLIGSLISDNKSLSFAQPEFTSATYDSITNLQGVTGLTFGIRFNNFNSFTTVAPNTLASASSGISLKHYTTSPTLVKPTAASSTVTVTFPATIANSGVSVVRTK